MRSQDEVNIVVTQIMGAKLPEVIFGQLIGSKKEMYEEAKATRRRLSMIIHEDRVGFSQKLQAKEAFCVLSSLLDEAKTRIDDGIYGSIQPTKFQPASDPVIIKAKKGQYVVTAPLYGGDVCDLYQCTFLDNGTHKSGILKVAKDPRDNEMVKNEAKVLKKLYENQDTIKLRPFIPELVDSLSVQIPPKSTRVQANVLSVPEDLYSLEEISKEYSSGLDIKDVAWMWRRILVAIRFAHINGIIHGAVTPAHMLFAVKEHGLVIIGWCQSVENRSPIKIISTQYEEFYPPEVFKKEAAIPATDIYMSAMCIIKLLGGKGKKVPSSVPRGIAGLLNSCILTQSRLRPDNAWDLHERFGEVLDSLWPRAFRHLDMPKQHKNV